MRIRFRHNKVLARTLETERFILKPMGNLETFRMTDSWRSDPAILEGVMYAAVRAAAPLAGSCRRPATIRGRRDRKRRQTPSMIRMSRTAPSPRAARAFW